MINKISLTDAHCHLDGDVELVAKQKKLAMIVMVNCQSAQEFLTNQTLTKSSPNHYLSAGIHPWQSDVITLEEMYPIFEQVDFIGEIGLDSLWTTVPLSIQRPIFDAQLRIAMQTNKAVILHTKGAEKEIADRICAYPNRYLVHWYSDFNYLDDYLKSDCIFSVGPDVEYNLAVQHLVDLVPLDKLTIESDGLAALTWAKQRVITACEYAAQLQFTIDFISKIKQVPSSQVANICQQNLMRFIMK